MISKFEAVKRVNFLFSRLSYLEKREKEIAVEKEEVIKELKSYGYKRMFYK